MLALPSQWVQEEVTTETLERKGKGKSTSLYLLLRNIEKGLLHCTTPCGHSGIALGLNFHGIGFWSVAAEPAVTSSANLFSMTMQSGSARSLSAVSMLDRCLWLRDVGQRPHDDGVCSSQMPQWLCWRRWGQRQDVTQGRRCYRTAARTCLWNNYAKWDKADEEGFFSLLVSTSAGVSLKLMRCLATLFSPHWLCSDVLLWEVANIFRIDTNKWE